MYQALYRKWRPQTFDDVAGQEHITNTLKNQVAAGRLSHAYLFVGTRGTGKTTCAKILARAVNCEHPVDGNPCNECDSCRGILDGSILDVVELDAASYNKVDDVRALQDEAVFSPAAAKMRVYIIDEVHMLSTAAFNALLKILEEPPGHLMFILCTTELHKVLPTIVSRCQRHSFKRIPPSVITERLLFVAQNEGIDLTQEAAELISRMADGGLRDALSLLDQCSARSHIDLDAVHSSLGLAGNRRIETLCSFLFSSDTSGALTLFDELWRDGKDPAGILDELGDLIRDILLMKTAPTAGTELLSGTYAVSFIHSYADTVPASELFGALQAIQDADLSGSNPRRAAEMCLVGISDPASGGTLMALNRRITNLERSLPGGTAPSGLISPMPVSSDDSGMQKRPDPEEQSIPQHEEELPSPLTQETPPYEKDTEESVPTEAGTALSPDRLWDELVKSLNGKIDMSAYAFLQSPQQCTASLADGEYIIRVSAPFARSMLDTPAHVALISEVLSGILGNHTRVRFADGSAPSASGPDHTKLDALKKYPIVTFE